MLSRAKSCELVIDEHDPDATPLNFAQNSNPSKPDSCSACDLQLSDGVLSIAGDRGDNVVQVEDQGNQVVSVVCFDQGDDIPDADVFRGVTSVIARLAAGNDTFEHRSKHPSVANVQALLGEGEDTGLVEMVAGADSAREMHVEMHDGEEMSLKYQNPAGLVSLQANGSTSTANPDCLAWDLADQDVYSTSINVGNVAVELGGHIDGTTEAIGAAGTCGDSQCGGNESKYQTSAGLVSLQASTATGTTNLDCLAWDIVDGDAYFTSINVGDVIVELGGHIDGTTEAIVRPEHVEIHNAEEMSLKYQTPAGLVSLQASAGTATTNPDCLAWDIVGQNVYEASINVGNVAVELGGHIDGTTEAIVWPEHVEIHNAEEMSLKYQTPAGLVSLQASGSTTTHNPDCLIWDIVGEGVYESSINVGNVAVEVGGPIVGTSEVVVRPEHVEIHNAEEMSLKYQTSGGLVSLQASGSTTTHNPDCLIWDIVSDDVFESSISVRNVAVELGGQINGTTEAIVRPDHVEIHNAEEMSLKYETFEGLVSLKASGSTTTLQPRLSGLGHRRSRRVLHNHHGWERSR